MELNHRSHVIFLVLNIYQNPNPGEEQLRDIFLTAINPSSSHQRKKVRHRFQHSDRRVVQFSGFSSSMFLLQQGWGHQSYQLVLQKPCHGNLTDTHFQNVCTDILAYTVLLYQNFYFYTSWSMHYKIGQQFDQCIVFHTYYESSNRLDICHYSQNDGLS